jgi:hypothetical protein
LTSQGVQLAESVGEIADDRSVREIQKPDLEGVENAYR